MKYTFEISVTGIYTTTVEADSEDEAFELAEEKYSEADSGDFDIYEGNWDSINGKPIDGDVYGTRYEY